ncbi:C40 family peptidase [Afifella pfennigii]|uniref:C40 family peptidase n=1 Tax=Afifella pfennigii TaxID=209897 RepID=UPI00047E14DF|nr:NlpC/P60 family protein [Afifella pfennigii]
MRHLDPRLNAFRPDVADIRLEGQVEAERFVDATLFQVAEPLAPLRRRPMPDAPLETEALCGEVVRVFQETPEGWVWGQLARDRYVGYLPANALRRQLHEPTHVVGVPSTLVFPGPDIKLPPLASLPLGAEVAVTGEARDHNARYLTLTPAGAIVAQHLVAVGSVVEPDFTATAERLIGVPYLWGGKGWGGIDCSGLVQVALNMAGHDCPRDSDMQAEAIGAPLDLSGGLPALRRGDIVFWKGHVGIMRDESRLVHANVLHMAVASEPLAAVQTRLGEKGLTITAIRRL